MATNTEPKWYQDMMKYGKDYNYTPTAIAEGMPPYTVRDANEEPNTITLRSGSEDMIKCNTEGFWVRGVKVAQDDKEAEVVYNAFKEWLTWATISDIR